MAFKYVLPALAFAGFAFAQCGDGSDFTIMSTGDTSKFTGCTTWNGNIIIDGGISGAVQIDYLTTISGDLRCVTAPGLNSITASRLQSITGELHLEDIQNLGTIEMDFLTSVTSIKFIGLPNLYTLQFATGITQATDVYISNTMLRDLKGIELTLVSSMDINNNMQLNTVNVNNMTNVTTALSFSANGDHLDVSLPNLVGAKNLTFRTVSSVDIPSLYEVPGAVGFYGNNFLNVSAANLTRIGNSLAIVGNSDLTEISFPVLNLVNGGLIIANNTGLKSVEGLPMLARIGGAIDLYGTFDSADLPALNLVKGGATIVTSSSNSSICNAFQTQKNNKLIQGTFDCQANVADPTVNVSSSNSGKKSAASTTGSSLPVMLASSVGLLAASFLL